MSINSTSTHQEVDQPMTFDRLSKIQKQKFAYLSSVYENESAILALIPLIDGRGENSWQRINDKLESIRTGDYKQKQHQDSLYENFEIGKVYEPSTIIKIVGAVRRDNGLPAYMSSLKANCEREFFNLFIVHQVFQEVCSEDDDPSTTKVKRTLIGYMPMFRLKPED